MGCKGCVGNIRASTGVIASMGQGAQCAGVLPSQPPAPQAASASGATSSSMPLAAHLMGEAAGQCVQHAAGDHAAQATRHCAARACYGVHLQLRKTRSGGLRAAP